MSTSSNSRQTGIGRICVDPVMATVVLTLLVGLVMPNVYQQPVRTVVSVGVFSVTVIGLAYLAVAKRWLWLLNVVAALVYAIGLLSPLTPSEGTPSVFDVLAFVGTPIALLAVSLSRSRGWAARAITLLQIAAIVGFTVDLLWL